MELQPFISKRKMTSMITGGNIYLQRWNDLLHSGFLQADRTPDQLQEMAKQQLDCGNAFLARQLRMAATSWKKGDIKEAIQNCMEGSVIAKALTRLKDQNVYQQLDILHKAGLNQRKTEIKNQPIIQDDWTVLGKKVQKLENLNLYITTFQSHSNASFAQWLQYEHYKHKKGITHFWPGEVIHMGVKFFPSDLPLRIHVESWDRPPQLQPQWKGLKGWKKWLEQLLVRRNHAPWDLRSPWMIDHLALGEVSGHAVVASNVAKDHCYLLFQDQEDALTIAAASQGQEFGLFGLGNSSTFEIQSLRVKNQIVPIQPPVSLANSL